MSNSLLKKLPKEILRQNEIIKSDELRLHDNKIICLYFSASWCAPCKKFTPLLIDFYKEIGYLPHTIWVNCFLQKAYLTSMPSYKILLK